MEGDQETRNMDSLQKLDNTQKQISKASRKECNHTETLILAQ